jgi:hypothetical protein
VYVKCFNDLSPRNDDNDDDERRDRAQLSQQCSRGTAEDHEKSPLE